MLSQELIKYVALQMLVLAASLDENLSKSGAGNVLPLTFETSPLPSNLPALISDATARVALLKPANSLGNPPAAAAGAPVGKAADAVTPSQTPVPPVVAGAPPVHAAAPPSPPVAHPPASPAAAAHPAPTAPKRKRRSVAGAVSEIADTVGDAAEQVADNRFIGRLGVAPVAGAVAAVADGVEQQTKPLTTSIGEAVLS